MTNELIKKAIETVKTYLDMDSDVDSEYLNAQRTIIQAIEQQPSEDRIRELIREFDNKHPALFADYMREFNNHPISEIIEYLWDMHDLIEDIKHRLPDNGGEENA